MGGVGPHTGPRAQTDVGTRRVSHWVHETVGMLRCTLS